MQEKEAGFAILNSLPGATVDKETAKVMREADKACKRLEKLIREVDEWLSLDNDALFR